MTNTNSYEVLTNIPLDWLSDHRPVTFDPMTTRARVRPPALRPSRRRMHRGDLLAGAIVIALVLAAIAGCLWWNPGRQLGPSDFFGAGPMFGEWPILGTFLPHVGPGTVPAVLLAAAVVIYGPVLAQRLPWRVALTVAYVTAVAWTFALALIDGWQVGIAGRLTTSAEYLHDVPGITDIGAMLRSFTRRILDYQPDSWTTHVAGHPPGATLVFVWLERIGLGGGGAAGVACILAGALTAIAVPATIAALGRRDLALAALPFLVLFPGAIWMGVSADALFAGVTAIGIMLLAFGTTRRLMWSLPAGLLLGFGIFLSYGLLLIGVLAVAIIVLTRRWQALVVAVLAAGMVVAAFAAAGFWWLDGYHNLVIRYYQGIAAHRPYSYWVWANLACLSLATGPVIGPALRRCFTTRTVVTAIVGSVLLAVLIADLSGLSKAEVERIWLPYAVWLASGSGLLPRSSQRWWLTAQAITALIINHVMLTNW